VALIKHPFDFDFSKLFPEIGQEIWHFPTLPRAMEAAKKFINLYPRTANGRIIRADMLLEAKGRFDRKWFAEKGGLWLSLSLYDEFFEEHASLISLIPGLAMVRCAKHLGITKAKVKWINDLHINGKKLGGVLIERYNEWYIIGLGINVNNPLPKGIPSESLGNLLKKEVSILELLEILVYWLRYYFGFLRWFEQKIRDEESVTNLVIEDFKQFTDTLGRCVGYGYNIDLDDYLIAQVTEITPYGSLILNSEEGLIEVSTGEILYLL